MSPSQKLKKKLSQNSSKAVLRKQLQASPKPTEKKGKKVKKTPVPTAAAPPPDPTPVIRLEDWAAVWKASLSDNEDDEWLSGKI